MTQNPQHMLCPLRGSRGAVQPIAVKRMRHMPPWWLADIATRLEPELSGPAHLTQSMVNQLALAMKLEIDSVQTSFTANQRPYANDAFQDRFEAFFKDLRAQLFERTGYERVPKMDTTGRPKRTKSGAIEMANIPIFRRPLTPLTPTDFANRFVTSVRNKARDWHKRDQRLRDLTFGTISAEPTEPRTATLRALLLSWAETNIACEVERHAFTSVHVYEENVQDVALGVGRPRGTVSAWNHRHRARAAAHFRPEVLDPSNG